MKNNIQQEMLWEYSQYITSVTYIYSMSIEYSNDIMCRVGNDSILAKIIFQ